MRQAQQQILVSGLRRNASISRDAAVRLRGKGGKKGQAEFLTRLTHAKHDAD